MLQLPLVKQARAPIALQVTLQVALLLPLLARPLLAQDWAELWPLPLAPLLPLLAPMLPLKLRMMP